MSFGGFNDNKQPAPMAEINVTPMVDVMLVLLVIFILAAPLFTHAIKLDLPAAQSEPVPAEPTTVSLSIDGEGRIFWNLDAVSFDQLRQKLEKAATQQPQPQVQLRADRNTRYETIAQVMAAAQSQGLTRLGFVTEVPAEASAQAGQ
ncbi:transport-related membrane protein [Oxalicibacterium flavum]|uniref:Transport-related membrane protein n=1 Tax=Oxalicibacterium flavum TaxID=179467 RepID=A0A8J2ULV7_9BURK|nr:biopolymer transporter ExbD [Oxalicibacterium flavum]GGC08746.1 transport-related membrane protein [Oxalicibacterium flavum]